MLEYAITDLDHDIKTWNPKFYPTPMRLFYFPMVELGYIPCSHMVKEYEGLLFILVSYYTRTTFPYYTRLVLDFVLIE